MQHETVKIFLRLKPKDLKKRGALFKVKDGEKEKSSSIVIQNSNDDTKSPSTLHKFSFTNIFSEDANQETIFSQIALPVIENSLLGYNGTIFAYGQTGSGKTYTITGGGADYEQRGLIPRALAHLFDAFDRDRENEYQLSVSYLEIYNDVGYDLLDDSCCDAKKLEDLARVYIFEGKEHNAVYLKNLSIHPAFNLEEALNFLFMGDTNRMIAETPMNMASTRSHCIFTMHILRKSSNGEQRYRSKLNLVDLAGSERVHKTGVDGTLLQEAKYINLSLHYLEQVIIALSEKHRSHIPYRNSMMTTVLRDSLGGNCLTSMIATASVEQDNIHETLSTCRFAQRVAMIKNQVAMNLELDPETRSRSLQAEVDQLRLEVAHLKGEQPTRELTSEERDACKRNLENFFALDRKAVRDVDQALNAVGECFPATMFSDLRSIKFCLAEALMLFHREQRRLRRALKASASPAVSPKQAAVEEAVSPCGEALQPKDLKALREIIAQRDQELQVLFSIWKQDKQTRQGSATNANNSSNVMQPQVEAVNEFYENQAKSRIIGSLSRSREEAFEAFKRNSPMLGQIEEAKEVLRTKYALAKSLGSRVAELRTRGTDLKAQLTEDRLVGMSEKEYSRLRGDLEETRRSYREAYENLKVLKPEIEHVQHNLETWKIKLVQGFETWWQEHVPSTSSPGNLQEMVDENGGEEKGVGFPLTQRSAQADANNNNSGAPATIDGVPLTGDPAVDADIIEFLQARRKIRRQQ